MAITAYGIPLAPVTSLKYLSRFLSVEYYDWPVVVLNLQRTRKKWALLIRVLIREGTYTQSAGQIFGGVAVGHTLQVRDVGCKTAHGEGLEGSATGCTAS